MSKARADARPVTKMIIWGRAGGLCHYRNCHERLDGDLASGNLNRNKSYIAHIIAAAPGGERGDPVLSPQLADDPGNLMLMCDAHHREIDDPLKLDIYTVDVLRAMKTTQAIYDNLDRSRALQAYLLGIPIVNQLAMRNALKEYGPVNTTDVIWEDLVESKTVELTANDNVVYSFVWLDTSKGPLVMEVPPDVLGLIDDMW